MKEKLKTLKDLLHKDDCASINLKQEAIKHIKYLHGESDDMENLEEYIEGKVDWIKHFFNITESELENA